MLVNYFCGVADKLKSLARQAQVAGPVGSSHLPGWLKAPAPQSQKPDLFFPYLLVLQVPNIFRLVVDRDRLNLGVV